MTLVEYTNKMRPHWCNKGHLGYVLKGRMQVKYSRRSMVLGPGDAVVIPSGYKYRHMGIPLSKLVSVLMFG